MRRRPTRREFGAGLVLAGTVGLRWRPAIAQTNEVRVAMIAPLSGPWARQGQLMRMGADMAIEEINEKGGIKALGGAKLTLVVADAGDRVRGGAGAGRHRGSEMGRQLRRPTKSGWR